MVQKCLKSHEYRHLPRGYAKYPERFRVVKPIDPANPAVDDVLADWAKTKGAVGVRLMLREEQISDPTDPRLNRVFAAAGRHALPVNLCWGRLEDGTEAGRETRTPSSSSTISAAQPNAPPPGGAVGESAEAAGPIRPPNVRIKISGACTLSREAFPYNNIWEPVLRIIDAFGIDRCMWGTDRTRNSGCLPTSKASHRFATPIVCPPVMGRSLWVARWQQGARNR